MLKALKVPQSVANFRLSRRSCVIIDNSIETQDFFLEVGRWSYGSPTLIKCTPDQRSVALTCLYDAKVTDYSQNFRVYFRNEVLLFEVFELIKYDRGDQIQQSWKSFIIIIYQLIIFKE